MKYTVEVDEETVAFFKAYIDDCDFETEELIAKMLVVFKHILIESMQKGTN